MAQKFIILDTNGNLIEKEGLDFSQGNVDAGNIVALNDDGKIDYSMLPDLDLEFTTCIAEEDINAGNLVFLFYDDVNNVLKCRKAIATDIDTIAHGFVKETVTAGNEVTVYFEGIFEKSGNTLLVGSEYFLSNTTAGEVTHDASTIANGQVIQKIGKAVGLNKIQFEKAQPIIKILAETINGGSASVPPTSTIDGGDSSTEPDTFIDGGNANG